MSKKKWLKKAVKTSKSLQIRATSNGPIIIDGDKLIVLTDDDLLIELCENDPNVLDMIQSHIVETLRSSMKDFTEAVEVDINGPPNMIYSYISAAQQFFMFKTHRWYQYLIAIEETNQEPDCAE